MLIESDSKSLDDFLGRGPYVGYCYSYPHKTAYRALEPRQSLASAWRDEATDAMFLYVHLPFCEFRCGFCNLFTFSQPLVTLPDRYLETLRRQANAVANNVSSPTFNRMAIGGGTPTYLTRRQLETLFEMLSDVLGVDGTTIPISLEASPATLDAEKLRAIRDFGVDRLSLGVQSFNAQDVGALGRPQRRREVDEALDNIRGHDFPTLNLDLIYGGQGQTVASWIESVEETLRYAPEEIYLYPLYVRPLTGLSNITSPSEDVRLACYREARDLLVSRGYQQMSMRMFQHKPGLPEEPLPRYCCQEDGMIGLGCGARSYTRRLHYGSDFAVKQAAIAKIIDQYVAQSDQALCEINHGIELDDQERRRRYLIISLLLVEGLSLSRYADVFASELLDDFTELINLVDRRFANVNEDRFCLSPSGIELSDAIGPWLYSLDVRRRMEEFEMETRLNILYRGPLSSCNYGCDYCPFAKHHETAAELAHDRRCLRRFVDWLATQPQRPHGVLFTPWGEALTRRWYREAMVRLSHMDHLQRVAVQTNLSCPLAWIRDANLDRFALWCTFHPGEVTRSEFIDQCRELDDLGVRYSVGVVGLREHAADIEALRDELAAGVYLWINAYKRTMDYYDPIMFDQFTAIDPWFPINSVRHVSQGRRCRTGETVISIDGQGDIRRCHFISTVLGNIYTDAMKDVLRPRACTNDTCGCHIGYVHMPHLKLDHVFQESILERIPAESFRPASGVGG